MTKSVRGKSIRAVVWVSLLSFKKVHLHGVKLFLRWWSRNFPPFMPSEDSFPCLQEFVTGPYLGPDESSPQSMWSLHVENKELDIEPLPTLPYPNLILIFHSLFRSKDCLIRQSAKSSMTGWPQLPWNFVLYTLQWKFTIMGASFMTNMP